MLFSEAGLVGDGGNSGFRAVNIAAQFCPQRLVLVGFDMRLDGDLHFHGPHPRPLRNPKEKNIIRWRAVLDGVAVELAERGIEVVVAGSASTLSCYKRMTMAAILEG